MLVLRVHVKTMETSALCLALRCSAPACHKNFALQSCWMLCCVHNFATICCLLLSSGQVRDFRPKAVDKPRHYTAMAQKTKTMKWNPAERNWFYKCLRFKSKSKCTHLYLCRDLLHFLSSPRLIFHRLANKSCQCLWLSVLSLSALE